MTNREWRRRFEQWQRAYTRLLDRTALTRFGRRYLVHTAERDRAVVKRALRRWWTH